MKSNTGWSAVVWFMFSGAITPAYAADVIYLDEASFFTAAGPLTMESFESLALSTDVNTIDAGAFTISTATNALRVRNDNVLGSFATDGTKYVRWDSTGSKSVLFTFDTPANRFGLTLTDPLDGGPNPKMSLTTNGGASFSAALTGIIPSGSIRFLGLLADNAFTQLTLTVNLNDGIGMDEVLYNTATINPVPEPGSIFLLGSGILGLIANARRRKGNAGSHEYA